MVCSLNLCLSYWHLFDIALLHILHYNYVNSFFFFLGFVNYICLIHVLIIYNISAIFLWTILASFFLIIFAQLLLTLGITMNTLHMIVKATSLKTLSTNLTCKFLFLIMFLTILVCQILLLIIFLFAQLSFNLDISVNSFHVIV